MSIKNPITPRSPEPPAPVHSEELAGDETIQALFDARPTDNPSQPNIVEKAINALVRACRDAADWIAQVFSRHDIENNPIGEISKPRNFKKLNLPSDLKEEIDKHIASKLADEKKAAFVASDDLPPVAAEPPNQDRDAFNTYIILCKADGKEPGSIDCSKNFNDKAVRYAKGFVENVIERKATSAQAKREFWLTAEDQATLRIAKGLLERQKDKNTELKNLIREVEQLGPIQTHTTQQLTQQLISFTAWQKWQQDPKKLPDESVTIDAATAYAQQLSAQYAGTDNAKNREVKQLLDSAADLIANKDAYRKKLEDARMNAGAADILKALGELRDSSTRNQGTQPVAGQADASRTGVGSPPASPPPRVRGGAGAHASAPTVGGNAPPRPAPRTQAAQSPQLAATGTIPDLATLDEDLQVTATVLLNQFFQQYASQLDRGNDDFSRNPEYFSDLAASAAADFLRRVSSGEIQPGTTDPRSFAAANRILQEYARRENPPPGSGT